MLLVKAREAKEYLTYHGEAPLAAKLSSGEWFDLGRVTSEKFCEITQQLVAENPGAYAPGGALRDAGGAGDEVKGVVMVGGATRMPQIQRAVAEFFRRDPLNKPRPGQGGRARRRDAGECPGG